MKSSISSFIIGTILEFISISSFFSFSIFIFLTNEFNIFCKNKYFIIGFFLINISILFFSSFSFLIKLKLVMKSLDLFGLFCLKSFLSIFLLIINEGKLS